MPLFNAMVQIVKSFAKLQSRESGCSNNFLKEFSKTIVVNIKNRRYNE